LYTSLAKKYEIAKLCSYFCVRLLRTKIVGNFIAVIFLQRKRKSCMIRKILPKK
jgi:hypothetical protein